MGDISIIARRLSDRHVQYGWSGNGGYFRSTGIRLLAWYQAPEDVEYLFELGQTGLIGRVGSERGGYSAYETHQPTGEGFWLGSTERMIFSKIEFVDYGYFYDLDHKWYYIIPGPFRIKLPLQLIANKTDDNGFEFGYLQKVAAKIADYIFNEYKKSDSQFKDFLEEKGYDSNEILNEICKDGKLATYADKELYVVIDYDDVCDNGNYEAILYGVYSTEQLAKEAAEELLELGNIHHYEIECPKLDEFG